MSELSREGGESVIDKERLWNRLMALSQIGREEGGGITRLSFTEEEREAQILLRSYMKEAGLTVRSDAVGNLSGRLEGRDMSAPVVLIGSHIDSVYNGGNFDGPLGVLAALEVLQTLQEDGIKTVHPVEMIVMKDEEGARFGFGMLGSRGIAGTLQHRDLERRDHAGISIAEAMLTAGLDPGAIRLATRARESVIAYVELHIEQGKVLERENLSTGIVSGMFGLTWLKFVLEGEAGHAGATPMNLRRDALAAAGEIIRTIEHEVIRTGSSVGTVGQLQVFPGGINIIPGRVEFTLDLRDTSGGVLQQLEEVILSRTEETCRARGILCQVEVLQRIAPISCSERVQVAIRHALGQLGLRDFTLVSGAGHDGMQFAHLWPVGMIFVRSKAGVSHSPAEWSSPADCCDGARVLYEVVKELSGSQH